jgi:plastocyanin
MNIKLIGSIVIGALLITTGIVVLVDRNTRSSEKSQNTTQSNSGEKPVAGENEVIYTDSGFDPPSIVVAQGTTVTFINKSSGSVWPASDAYPTNLLYPEFNANKDIPADQVFSFTFNKVGTWGYHDDLDPTKTGKVVVQ